MPSYIWATAYTSGYADVARYHLIHRQFLELIIDKVTCVFVHGWSMNAAVWESCASLLPEWIDAVFVDLPGHGNMHDVDIGSLDDMVNVVAAVANRPVVWVGWSLGGLVCQRLAVMYPDRVRALYLVASTPKFVSSDSWQSAVSPQVFQQFSTMFTQDIEKTIKRFLALQLMGTDNAKQVMQQLDAAMTQRGMPATHALQIGLEILEQADLRQSLVALEKPVGCLLGQNDMLIPVVLAAALTALNPAIDIVTQAGAGHAPFVSHPQQFVSALQTFLNDHVCTP